MQKGNLDKSKLPSRHVTEGPARAPHRSYFLRHGPDRRGNPSALRRRRHLLEPRPRPCNIALSRQAQSVKLGVKHANGTPREFTTITVTDGIAMGHEGDALLAGQPRRHCRHGRADDARGIAMTRLGGLAGCDKSLPGMMMAMVRLNVPSVFHLWRVDPARPGWMAATSPCRTCSRAVGQQKKKNQAGNLSDEVARGDRTRSPVRVPGPVAGSSPPTPWPACPRRSGSRCPTLSGAPAPYESRDQYGRGLGRGGDDACWKKASAPATWSLARASGTPRGSWPALGGVDQTRGFTCRPSRMRRGFEFDLFDVCRTFFHDTPYFRRHEARRPVRGQGPLRGGRRACRDEGAQEDRPHPRGLQ